MKFSKLYNFGFCFLTITTFFPISAQSRELLVLSVNPNSTLNFISVTPDSNSVLSLPEEFSSQGLVFQNRVQVSKKRILAMNQFAYSDRKLLVFDRETGQVTKLKYPLDTGLKILRTMYAYIEALDVPIFGEIHRSGEQRLFRLENDKPVYLSHFDTYRKTAKLDDFRSTGDHIFRISIKDKSVNKLESVFSEAEDGFSQKLLYCNNLNCKPEEVVSDRAILNARLVNDGKHILFLTPVSYDKEYKYYNLETYDLIAKKRTKLMTFRSFGQGNPGFFTKKNPEFRVIDSSSLVFFSTEFSTDAMRDENWKLVDVQSGLIQDYKLPEGYKFAPMLPVSYHTESNDTDVTTLDPYIIFVKNYFDQTQGWQSSLKVIQFPENKTVLDVDMKNRTVQGAIYTQKGE